MDCGLQPAVFFASLPLGFFARGSFVLAPLAALLLSCSASPREPWPESVLAAPPPSPIEVGVGESASEPTSEEYVQRFQPDVRINARMENGAVRIDVLNKSGRRLEVGPGNFGVIAAKRLFRAAPGAAVVEFPMTVLDPGEGVSGRIRFLKLGDLTGQYCVFNHRDVRPSRCTIGPKGNAK